MDRLVCYSVTLPADDPRPDLLWQLDASLATLRAHTPRLPVVVFLHGSGSPELSRIAQRHDAWIEQSGAYERRLAELSPGWPALAALPLLHKWLNFPTLAAWRPRQVLALDCDTIVARDLEVLFDAYDGPDVVAREEVHTSRSAYGADPSFVDEALLARLAAHEGAAVVPPFNTGVVLFNNGIVAALRDLGPSFVEYVWRFVTSMTMRSSVGGSPELGDLACVAAAARAVGPADRRRALPYPSSNRWLVEEVALWLALGHVPGLTLADLRPADVAQNGEFAASDPRSAGWVLCHYFSNNRDRIHAWLEARPAAALP